MNILEQSYAFIKDFLDRELFAFGDAHFTLFLIFKLIILIALLFIISNKIKVWLSEGILTKTSLPPALNQAIGTITRYIFLLLGFIIILQGVGVKLSALTVVVGALGVGLGFGLQNIVSNFVSGLIILFERPIKIGDRVQLGDVEGTITDISIRTTTVVSNDNISIIVPNSQFIDKEVTNWSHNNRRVRLNISIGVSYNSDVEKVKEILLGVANECKGVLTSPIPDVIFEEFGDSSLNFILRVWTEKYTPVPLKLKSELNFEIFKSFKEHNIEIPFPQRDIHIISNEKSLIDSKK